MRQMSFNKKMKMRKVKNVSQQNFWGAFSKSMTWHFQSREATRLVKYETDVGIQK